MIDVGYSLSRNRSITLKVVVEDFNSVLRTATFIKYTQQIVSYLEVWKCFKSCLFKTNFQNKKGNYFPKESEMIQHVKVWNPNMTTFSVVIRIPGLFTIYHPKHIFSGRSGREMPPTMSPK